MVGMLAPPAQLAEFFGLWTFATYGGITWATGGDQRLAIVSTAQMFGLGLVLLLPVDMHRGRAAALSAPPAV